MKKGLVEFGMRLSVPIHGEAAAGFCKGVAPDWMFRPLRKSYLYGTRKLCGVSPRC
jgi:hypothetical protein